MSKENVMSKLKKTFTTSDEYDYDTDLDGADEMDFSGKSNKSVNLVYMKEENEYKKITEALKRGSICIVNLEELDEKGRASTRYRIDGILDAVKGSKDIVSENVYLLLPKDFIIKKINEYVAK